MDQRQIFYDPHQLFAFVTAIAQQKQKASLLIHKNGLERVEGIISAINQHQDISNTSIIIDDRDTILLKEIIGINGLFRSDYSEC